MWQQSRSVLVKGGWATKVLLWLRNPEHGALSLLMPGFTTCKIQALEEPGVTKKKKNCCFSATQDEVVRTDSSKADTGLTEAALEDSKHVTSSDTALGEALALQLPLVPGNSRRPVTTKFMSQQALSKVIPTSWGGS